MAWRGYVTADHAIIDPNIAWDDAQDLFSPTLDSGVSKAQILYWISTRKGFVPSNNTDTTSSSSDNAPDPSASCSLYSSCVDIGLGESCCLTTDGIYLGCCSKSNTVNSSITHSSNSSSIDNGNEKSAEPTSSCTLHPQCVVIGLGGACSPTTDGIFLGCCSGGKDAISSTDNNIEKSSADSASACSAHSKCVDIGLSGACCPTGDGSVLGCCSR